MFIYEILSLACEIFPHCGSIKKTVALLKCFKGTVPEKIIYHRDFSTLLLSLERINSNCLCVPCHLIQYLEGLIYYMIYTVWYPSRCRTFLSFILNVKDWKAWMFLMFTNQLLTLFCNPIFDLKKTNFEYKIVDK